MADKNPVTSKNPVKFKTKTQKQTSRPVFTDPEDRVAVGNKPKSSIYGQGPKLLTTKGAIVHINLKPTIPVNPDQSAPEPRKSSLYAIPIREHKRALSFDVKLDLPEQENPFYQTEKHRQNYIQEQLKAITSSIGLTYFGDIVLEEWIDLLEKNGWSVDLELQVKETA